MNNQLKSRINEAFPSKTSKAVGILSLIYILKKIWKMSILQDLYCWAKDKFSSTSDEH